ncbi:2,3-bisphosphoglycerate-independent phosphoglycerate mutase, archaeal type [Grimontia indica]|uniref:2,3-bisphosphoglycerate-independent phosphoglycerate mutase, archaeal type n=1 Tax=Grimontia indica TaxID=1056512 RepID=R1IJF5_9GAMM|nr:2,3-bisphosphoglycerate-independent phosphoglycerate mutase [Grimontia indica]EOD77627.1 2,3-bisphosphoglycerate-independent phosphoglycerate mutase, archaeal type [Grimontia indica]
MSKQALLIIADGMGDNPISLLNGLTPLEYARTPNLKELASKGLFGNVYPVKPGVPVGTDVGHLAIFGYDPYEVYTGRGPIEAYGAGIDLLPSDIAFRGNFATVDDELTVIDRRAGRINQNTDELANAIDGIVLSNGARVIARALSAHRVAVVIRGQNLSEHISTTDPGTAKEGERVQQSAALVEDKNALETAKIINELTEKMYSVLSLHPVNQQRILDGLPPANMILLRGIGREIQAPKMAESFGIRGACVAGDRTVLGIARMAGLDVFHQEGFTAGYDTDYIGKAELAVSKLKEGYDWVVLHVKAPDLAGHDCQPMTKVSTAIKLDMMVGHILQQIDLEQCYIGYTSDHSTPCDRRDHSGDPVPTFFAGGNVRSLPVEDFGEKFLVHGALNNLTAIDFFHIQMDHLEAVRKLGA